MPESFCRSFWYERLENRRVLAADLDLTAFPVDAVVGQVVDVQRGTESEGNYLVNGIDTGIMSGPEMTISGGGRSSANIDLSQLSTEDYASSLLTIAREAQFIGGGGVDTIATLSSLALPEGFNASERSIEQIGRLNRRTGELEVDSDLLIIAENGVDLSGVTFLSNIHLKRRFETTSSMELPYNLFLPRGYMPSELYPLVLFLNGSGLSGTDNERQLWSTEGIVEATRTAQYASFFLAPQWPSGPWEPEPVKELVDNIMVDFGVDPSRVYVTGLSSGGTGTYRLLEEYPDFFAAALPLSSYPVINSTGIARYHAQTPTWSFIGERDNVPAEVIEHASNIRDAGGIARVTLTPHDHCCWREIYRGEHGDIYDWLFQQERDVNYVADTSVVGRQEIFSDNVATAGLATQSGTVLSRGHASFAIDGDTTTESRAVTEENGEHWWEVDLGRTLSITQLYVYGPVIPSQSLASGGGLSLAILDSERGVVWSQEYNHRTPSIEALPDVPVRGQYIRLEKVHPIRWPLEISELMVYTNEVRLPSHEHFVFDLGSDQTADQIFTAAQLFVNDASIEVIAGGNPPAFGDEFQLVDASAIIGHFDRIALPDLPDELAWDTSSLIEDGSIRVVPASIPADLDGSGQVDLTDFLILSRTFGLSGTGLLADLNNDGSVTFQDFLLFSLEF